MERRTTDRLSLTATARPQRNLVVANDVSSVEMTEAADTQLLLDVAAASAEEDTGWPSPPSCDTSLRDPELASVEQAWRTGQLAVAF